jgi:hypothetical protein
MTRIPAILLLPVTIDTNYLATHAALHKQGCSRFSKPKTGTGAPRALKQQTRTKIQNIGKALDRFVGTFSAAGSPTRRGCRDRT